MKVYENNFQRLMLLLPQLSRYGVQQGKSFQLLQGLDVSLLEQHKYTTVIKLSQSLPLPMPAAIATMMVRIYHDAQVAEVLSYQQHYRFKPKYDYPNPAMCQVREKQRVNAFLGEWLDFCLADDALIHQVVVT